jgi:hypothetical protein
LELYSEHPASTCDHTCEPDETVFVLQRFVHVPVAEAELEVVVMVELVAVGLDKVGNAGVVVFAR